VRLGRGEARALSFSGGSGRVPLSYVKPILRKKKPTASLQTVSELRNQFYFQVVVVLTFFTKILQLLIKKGLENFGIKTKRPIMDNRKTFYYPWSHRIFVESTAIPRPNPTKPVRVASNVSLRHPNC